jgi:hypothetical protein
MDESGNLYFTSRNEDWGAVTGKYSQVTGINEPRSSALPTEFSLSQNYPNPFNPNTKIKFTIPAVTLSGVEGSLVTLKVYDVLGNEIATLVNEEKPAGEYEVEFSAIGGSTTGGDAYNLTSGVYFYQLKAIDPESRSGQGFIQTKKMILLK